VQLTTLMDIDRMEFEGFL